MAKNEWEGIVKKAAIKSAIKSDNQKKNIFEKYAESLKGLVTVELLVGIIAAFSMFILFGWDELERTLLSWIIGITLVMTILTYMANRYKKITHFE
jgi:type IV secretory pathway VirB2 component (pilin)